MSRGALSQVHNISIYGEEVIEYWTIFSLKIHSNKNQNYRGIWVCSSPIVGKPLVNMIEYDFMKVIWKNLNPKIWILSNFYHLRVLGNQFTGFASDPWKDLDLVMPNGI